MRTIYAPHLPESRCVDTCGGGSIATYGYAIAYPASPRCKKGVWFVTRQRRATAAICVDLALAESATDEIVLHQTHFFTSSRRKEGTSPDKTW